MKEISDLHYLSPSGCTFWGKKPWSRKKKILWQLGTLIGAPVGIALIAGVAVPAILIGLPIWSGRKVYVRYKSIGKHKRNMIVTGTVAGTIVIAPLVAALAVGIGVPILLAYVYGVVPISLCRSGGCGVTKNNNGGVRFAFDDEQPTDTNTFFNFNSMINAGGKNNNETSKNTVSIPISAIETKAPGDGILLDNLFTKNSDANETKSQQTPVMVTITLANKTTKKTSSSSGNRQHRHRSTSSSNGSGRTKHRHSSSKHKHTVSACAAQTQPIMEKPSGTNSSASIACGLVDQSAATCSSSVSNRPHRSKASNVASNMIDSATTATLAVSETGTVAGALQNMTKSMQSDTLSSSSFLSNQVILIYFFLILILLC
jgi:hypothetical protein